MVGFSPIALESAGCHTQKNWFWAGSLNKVHKATGEVQTGPQNETKGAPSRLRMDRMWNRVAEWRSRIITLKSYCSVYVERQGQKKSLFYTLIPKQWAWTLKWIAIYFTGVAISCISITLFTELFFKSSTAHNHHAKTILHKRKKTENKQKDNKKNNSKEQKKWLSCSFHLSRCKKSSVNSAAC